MTDSRRLVDKLDSFRNLLRDDGVGVLDYIEQLTYLLFLKMAHERSMRKLKPQQIVPQEYSWQRLLDAEGVALEVEYTRILVGLAAQPGTLGIDHRPGQVPHKRAAHLGLNDRVGTFREILHEIFVRRVAEHRIDRRLILQPVLRGPQSRERLGQIRPAKPVSVENAAVIPTLARSVFEENRQIPIDPAAAVHAGRRGLGAHRLAVDPHADEPVNLAVMCNDDLMQMIAVRFEKHPLPPQQVAPIGADARGIGLADGGLNLLAGNLGSRQQRRRKRP